jgi:nitric oxide reductase subunit C
MLAKSQAKLFFLIGTGAFSAIFLGLTVDTLAQVPARSNEGAMSAEVVRGKELWERNNCMGCHTLLGEGAYYAPELTKVVDRRGKEWMKVFLADPNGMYPGQRKMVQYKFSAQEIDALIAFFEWIGKVDTNDFPPKPDLTAGAPAPATGGGRLATAPGTYRALCTACHAVEGQGGKVGPALDDLGAKFDEAALDKWLANPQAVKPGTAMPNLNLSPETRKELVSWLLKK